jgi:hypothetical protein
LLSRKAAYQAGPEFHQKKNVTSFLGLINALLKLPITASWAIMS